VEEPITREVTGAVTREVRIAASPERVWAALADPAELAAWFGAHVEIDLRPGGPVRFRWPDGSERRGLIVTLDPPRRLAFRWRETAGREPTGAEPTVVAFELESYGGATRVVVTESPGIADARPDQALLAEVQP